MFIFKESNVSNYLDMENEDLIVTSLLEKYGISTKESFLYNVNDDYDALLDFISELYIENKPIPYDIQNELNTNLNFKTYLLFFIKEKMTKILYDKSTIVFKEIVTIVNLLSFGKKFEIFESYNSYNLKQLGLLFREYEERLKFLKNENKEDFLLSFELYSKLIEVINELCTINSTDVLRKKTINPLVETLTETINILKFNIQLNEEQIDVLNNILGKLLFYYSHIPYIDASNKDSSYLIEEFKFNFEKITNGYNLSKNTNFGRDTDKKAYYKIYLNSISTLLLTLIYKLETTYKEEDYIDIKLYNEIIKLYKEEVSHLEFDEIKSLDEFKNLLLENYSFIYSKKEDIYNYIYIIDELLEKNDFNSSNMHIIHSLVLFSNDIQTDKLSQILKLLISNEKFKNDYHEFYKLNICDVIINKFIQKQEQLQMHIIEDLLSYIEINKIASHLMSTYSKLYLSLSLYYSSYIDIKSLESSALLYFKYLSINGKDLLENEYNKLNKDILINHGKAEIRKLKLRNIYLEDSKYIEIGQNNLEEFFAKQELNLKYNINQKLSNIVTEIFTYDGLNNDLLNKHIEKFISKDIFHGLTFVGIEGLCEHECHLIDLGYEKIEIELFDIYKLRMAYSLVYKDIFEDIYIKNKEYIKQNIINLIICYIKSIPIYYDPITKLFNMDKLKTELLQKEEELLLLELYIEDLMPLNKKYSYQKVNTSFKEYANNLSDLGNLYRFQGPKLAFLLDQNADYKKIIKKIKTFQFEIEEEKIYPKLIIAISWGNKDNIIEKSSHCMRLAEKSKEKYYEFK